MIGWTRNTSWKRYLVSWKRYLVFPKYHSDYNSFKFFDVATLKLINYSNVVTRMHTLKYDVIRL